MRASILTALGRMHELYFAQERLMNDRRCRYCRTGKTSRFLPLVPNKPSVANSPPATTGRLCSKLWSGPIPKRRRTGTSAGITDRRLRASAQLARGASGPALLEAISPGPSLHLRDQGESCKQQLGFRPKAFRETIDSGNSRDPVVAQSEGPPPIPSSPSRTLTRYCY